MDEFDFDDQRLPVRRGPPTDDSVPVFDDTGHETTAAAGSFRTREAGLDQFEAAKPARVTAVPATFAGHPCTNDGRACCRRHQSRPACPS
jgi:hypothetical protein